MKNIFNLEGKKAVVIGGGGGIGQAIAQGLAEHGVEVVISSRKLEGLQKAAKEIKDKCGLDVHCIACDCSSEESVIALKDEVLKLMGTVDILVNSQGLNIKQPCYDFPVDDWDRMFSINVRGMMLTCKHFGQIMRDKHYGRIINISSIRGARAVNGPMGNTGYASTKGAVDMMTKSLAGEWAKDGITVNAVGPILTMTEMMIPWKENNPEVYAKVSGSIPMGRLGEPEDCVGATLFFASDAAAFISGQVLYPDGASFCVG